MKSIVFKIFALAIFVGGLTSCSDEGMYLPGNQDALLFMDQKSFEVQEWEFYDHVSLDNYSPYASWDALFLTFNGTEAYLIKVDEENGISVRYESEELTPVFQNGVFKALLMEDGSSMEVVGFEIRGEQVTFELYGESLLSGQEQSIFVKSIRLDSHPDQAYLLTDLPG